MATRFALAPSLNLLFDEIDARWPRRDRRTDGWYNPARKSYGHNREERGLVHAIDVDRDGIDPNWIVANIHHESSVLWYIVWSRTIWSNTRNWRPIAYRGDNPHTDHMHIEIRHTVTGEQFNKGWNIAPAKSGFGTAPGFNVDFTPRDYRSYITTAANQFNTGGNTFNGAASSLRSLRR